MVVVDELLVVWFSGVCMLWFVVLGCVVWVCFLLLVGLRCLRLVGCMGFAYLDKFLMRLFVYWLCLVVC